MKPYYQDAEAGVTIYHGDSAEVLGNLEPGVACIATSPPYAAGIKYEDDPTGDLMAWADYWATHVPIMEAAARLLVPGGRVFWNVAGDIPTTVVPAGFHSGHCSQSREQLLVGWVNAIARVLEPRVTIAWCSQRGSGTAWGSWQTPAAPNLRGDWEAIHMAFRPPFERPTPPEWKGWRDGGPDWPQLVSTVWTVTPERRKPDGHPAPFPVEIPSRCIRLSTWPGETVLDPYMGSGSTLVAAKRFGRRAVGVERSERYCEIAAQALEAEALLGFEPGTRLPASKPEPAQAGLF